MKKSARLSVALHALVHLIDRPEPVTSTTLAECIMTNPVVVRRVMGELREAGLVASSKGHDGGWRLLKTAEAVSLADVHKALGESLLVRTESDPGNPRCTIVKTVDRVMGEFLNDAEALLAARLSRISLADLATERAQHMHIHHGA